MNKYELLFNVSLRDGAVVTANNAEAAEEQAEELIKELYPDAFEWEVEEIKELVE